MKLTPHEIQTMVSAAADKSEVFLTSELISDRKNGGKKNKVRHQILDAFGCQASCSFITHDYFIDFLLLPRSQEKTLKRE